MDAGQGMALGIEISVMARIITMVQSAVREGGQAEGKDECGVGGRAREVCGGGGVCVRGVCAGCARAWCACAVCVRV